MTRGTRDDFCFRPEEVLNMEKVATFSLQLLKNVRVIFIANVKMVLLEPNIKSEPANNRAYLLG